MDFERGFQNGLRMDRIRMSQFLKDTVLSVIETDFDLEEEAVERVMSLNIPDSESNDYTPQIGIFISLQLRRIRRQMNEDETRHIFRSLIMDVDPQISFEEIFGYFSHYVNPRCEWFNLREPKHYFHFLITVCEFCCKLAEVDGYEIYISMVLQRAELYMFLGAFPGYEALSEYALAKFQNMLQSVGASLNI